MDLATIIGMVLGFGGLIGGYALEGGSVANLMLLSPAVIVLGGTFGTVFISSQMKHIVKLPMLFGEAFQERKSSIKTAIETIVQLSVVARKEGLLSLENVLEEDPQFKNIDPIMKKGIMLAIDGTSPELISDILSSRIHVEELEKKAQIAMFDHAGGFAPTIGIIGTVMGLVLVLGNLEDAGELAHSIAAAFIATLYGVVLANIVFLPIGNKLKSKMRDEKLEKQVILEGVLSISAGDNPMLIKEKLYALIEEKGKKDEKGEETEAE